MFAAIGNREEQQRIRDLDPDVKHCRWLADSPHACIELPYDIAGVPAGSICPNNPYQRNASKILRLEARARLLEYAVDVHRSLRVGGINELSPRIDVVLAYAYQRFLDENQWQTKS